MDERDREWRDRDWRRSEAYGRGEERGRPGEPRRYGEERSWSRGADDDRVGSYEELRRRRMAYEADDDDYRGRSGVAAGPGPYGRGGRPPSQQAGRSGGAGRFSTQDYTGRGRAADRDDDDSGYRERRGGYRAGGWDPEVERNYERRRDAEQRRWPSGGYDQERGYDEARRAERGRAAWEGRGDERGNEGPGDFLQRAGERISSWFRGGRDDEREPYRRDRDDYVRQARGEDRGHRGRGPKGYQRTDERINDEVHERLTDDPWLDASDIQVEVKAGEVTLSGHVENCEAKHRAERLIEDLSGVKHVQNNLRVAERAGFTGAGRGFGSSALEAEMRRHEQATDPGNHGVSGLSGRTSTGAEAERSTSAPPKGPTKSN